MIFFKNQAKEINHASDPFVSVFWVFGKSHMLTNQSLTLKPQNKCLSDVITSNKAKYERISGNLKFKAKSSLSAPSPSILNGNFKLSEGSINWEARKCEKYVLMIDALVVSFVLNQLSILKGERHIFVLLRFQCDLIFVLWWSPLSISALKICKHCGFFVTVINTVLAWTVLNSVWFSLASVVTPYFAIYHIVAFAQVP